MLEFIVLGQIPGTHIVISFGSLLLCMAFGLGVWSAHNMFKHLELDEQNSPQTSATI